MSIKNRCVAVARQWTRPVSSAVGHANSPRPLGGFYWHAHLRFIICVPFLYVDGQNQQTKGAKNIEHFCSNQLEFKLKCQRSARQITAASTARINFSYICMLMHAYMETINIDCMVTLISGNY